MERGANTFPFHNLLPYSKSNEGLFLFFSPSLNWIKEKSVATLAIRNICDKKQNKSQSQFSHRITHSTCESSPWKKSRPSRKLLGTFKRLTLFWKPNILLGCPTLYLSKRIMENGSCALI